MQIAEKMDLQSTRSSPNMSIVVNTSILYM